MLRRDLNNLHWLKFKVKKDMKRKSIAAIAGTVLVGSAIASYFYLRTRKPKYAELRTANVDLEKYLGKWYDIAHLPASFMEGCYNTQAVYTLQEDGTIKVVNTCNKGSIHGPEDRAEGQATVADTNLYSKLEVEFIWPFKGDYWIIEVDQNYRYALVGEPSRKYLWILSREPRLEEKALSKLISRANEEGFATNNLIMTVHHV